MRYIYTGSNRLKEPCHYMYTSFEGEALLTSYFLSRNNSESLFDSRKKSADIILIDEFILSIVSRKVDIDENVDVSESNLDVLGKVENFKYSLPEFSISNLVDTSDLLCSLIVNQVKEEQTSLIKVWLDRLVQRFEVTKKIYKSYPAGFRKGCDTNSDIRLYWLFGLSLCLAYSFSKNLQYLSTLLKVTDLLCSLEKKQLAASIPLQGMNVIIRLEKRCVEELINSNIGKVSCF